MFLRKSMIIEVDADVIGDVDGLELKSSVCTQRPCIKYVRRFSSFFFDPTSS